MKHFKIFISVVVIFFSFFSMSTKAQSRYDVNSDGKVNITDAISVVNKILNGLSDNVNTPAEAVDLGLPSGTKWASYNLGASSPEDPGGRYAWGETEEKLVYSSNTYVNYEKSTDKYRNIGNDISGTVYDAAHVKWGGLWHMPSQAEIEELVSFCTYEWTTHKGVKGGKFIGPNGNSIFLPINKPALEWEYDLGCYWLGFDDFPGMLTGYYDDQSNMYASCLTLYSDGTTSYYYDSDYGVSGSDGLCRSEGCMIRPVYSNTSKTKMVDLGLPSEIKWASCNVGATCPEEVGDKYAWGEIGTKLEYTWDNYLFFDSLKHVKEETTGYSREEVVCQDIGNDISGTKYDVAHVKWGGNWRMPTNDELLELINNCTKTAIYLNGKSGHLFTGPNGNSIFIPNSDLWTSSVYEEYSVGVNSNALVFYWGFDRWYMWLDSLERCEGLYVRPVCSSSPSSSE